MPKKILAYIAGAVLGLSAFDHFLGLVEILTGTGERYVEGLGGTVGSALVLKLAMLGGDGRWWLVPVQVRTQMREFTSPQPTPGPGGLPACLLEGA